MATESVSYGSENNEQNLFVPVGIVPKQCGWTKNEYNIKSSAGWQWCVPLIPIFRKAKIGVSL